MDCTCNTIKELYYSLDCNKELQGWHLPMKTICLDVIKVYAEHCSYNPHRIIIKHDDDINKV
jgi:hypothetical protein